MADLIDRAALLKIIRAEAVNAMELTADRYHPSALAFGHCHSLVKRAPTIDAEPVKHGRWVGSADGYADGELVYDMWECSECGYDADGADEKPDWNYCPNCGAKMDGES